MPAPAAVLPAGEQTAAPKAQSREASEAELVDHIWRQVIWQADQAHVPLRADAQLSQAARALLPWAQQHAGEQLAQPRLQRAAWRAQISDAELAAVVVTSERAGLATALSAALALTLADNPAVTCAGLAVAQEGAEHKDRLSLVLVLSRRLVQLGPLPTTVAAGGDALRVCGRVLGPGGATVRMVVAEPGQPIWQRTLPPSGGDEQLFCGDYRAAEGPGGALHVQLLLERGLGPEVAAQWPVAILQPAGSKWAGLRASPPRSDDGLPVWATGRTLDWADAYADLNELRRRAHRAAVQPCPHLRAVAQAHAEDMAQHGFFAHASPRTGNALARVQRGGQRFVRVLENLAAAPSLAAAFAQWQTSPSHCLNLLDPQVAYAGLGLTRSPRGSGNWLVVLLLASHD